MTILGIILMASGMFFLAVSGLGILRFPDFYTRTHAVTKSETLGSLLLLLGLACYNGLELSSLKLLLIPVFIFIANPTASHALARAAARSGLEPWVLAEDKDTEGEVAKR